VKIEDKDKIELLLRMLSEAEEYIEKGDPIQASEKLYKASEEAIKELARRFELSEYEEAERNGRWTTTLLFKAVRRLSERVKPEILDWWTQAWLLHVEGFHEARLDMEEVKVRVSRIKELVNLLWK